MEYRFKTSGVCSREIIFEIEDGTLRNVQFVGGCAGNTQGVARLCEGRRAEEVIELLADIKCGFKGTSCPAQLAEAIKKNIRE